MLQTLKDALFILLQQILPQHLLSRLVGGLASCRWVWLKNFLISQFIDYFNVDMSLAKKQQASDFENFNEFFTRELKDGVRPICDGEQTLASPADGAISQLGDIKNGRIFQAKGQDFSLVELLGGSQERAAPFEDGQFATIYLSPKDYHRVHMPVTGTLKEMAYVPGDLYSVNQTTAENIPQLFARNERVVTVFETEHGPVAMVLVGAMIVAAVETVWQGQVAPPKRELKVTEYGQPQHVNLEKGEEMGRFLLGSTVILCFPKDTMAWDSQLSAGSALAMGEEIGQYQ